MRPGESAGRGLLRLVDGLGLNLFSRVAADGAVVARGDSVRGRDGVLGPLHGEVEAHVVEQSSHLPGSSSVVAVLLAASWADEILRLLCWGGRCCEYRSMSTMTQSRSGERCAWLLSEFM